MKRHLSLVLALALSSCATLSLPRAGTRQLPPLTSHPKLYALPSGVRVVIDRDATTSTVSLTTLIKGGGVSDPPGREGLSHLVGHLSLRSHTAAGLPYYLALEQAGAGAHDVHSTFDYTAFEAQGASATLARWLPMELERLAHPLEGVDEATFALTREIVRNELRERREMVEGADFEWIQEAVFPEGHPYRRPVLGSHQSLDALTLADAQAYAAAAYEPRNVTLFLTGDLDPATLASLQLQPVPAEAFAEVASPGEELVTPPERFLSEHSAGVANPRLYLVWTLPPGYAGSDELLRAVSAFTTQGLRDAWHYDEDVSSLSARTVLGARASLLVVTVELFRGVNPHRTMEHVFDYLVSLSHPFTMSQEAALEYHYRWTGYERALDTLYTLENPARRSRLLATDWTFAHRLDVLPRHLAQALDLSPQSSDALFGTYVTRDRGRGVMVWPMTGMEGAPAATRLPAMAPNPTPGPLAIDAAALAALTPPLATREARLENGLRVVVVPRPGWPVASATLAYVGGAATGPLGAARLTSQYAWPLFQTYGRARDYGLRTGHEYAPDLQVLHAEGKPENLPNILAQFSTQLTHLRLDLQLQTLNSRYIYPFERITDELPDRQAQRALARTLLPSSALGLEPVTDDLEKLSVLDVQSWANDAATPDGAVLSIVGDVDPDQALEAARTWLAGWSGHPRPVLAEPPRPANQVLTTVRPGASQSRLTWTCRVDGKTPRQRAAGEVLAQLLAQSQTDVLRDQLGLTTGVQGELDTLEGGTAWVELTTSLDGARLQEGLARFRGTLATVGEGSSAGLERARWAAVRKASLARADAPTLSAQLATGLARGYADDEVLQPSVTLGKVTSEDVDGALKACLQSTVTSLVADGSSLQAAAALRP